MQIFCFISQFTGDSDPKAGKLKLLELLLLYLTIASTTNSVQKHQREQYNDTGKLTNKISS